jgi:hypothetical protein
MTPGEALNTAAGEALNAAANLIERNGLAREVFLVYVADTELQDCSMCSLGALSFVVTGQPIPAFSPTSRRELLYRCEELLACEIDSTDPTRPRDVIGRWSDSTPQDEVVAKLRQVAAELVAS